MLYSFSHAQGREPEENQDSSVAIQLVLTSVRTTVPLEGCLELGLELRNRSKEVSVPFDAEVLGNGTPGVRTYLRVTLPGEEEQLAPARYGPGSSRHYGPRVPVGGAMSVGLVAGGLGAPEPFLFSRIGQYRILFGYCWEGVTYESNAVSVAVVEPGASSASARAYLRGMRNPLAVYYPRLIGQRTDIEKSRQDIEEVTRLANDFPSNPYTDCARIALAEWSMQRLRSFDLIVGSDSNLEHLNDAERARMRSDVARTALRALQAIDPEEVLLPQKHSDLLREVQAVLDEIEAKIPLRR